MSRSVPALIVSQRSLDLLARNAIGALRVTALPHGPGLFAIPLTLDVAQRLESRRLPGECDDDLLERLFAILPHGAN